MLDVTLSSTTLVHKLLLTWEYPARDVLVLYSSDAAGDANWELGGASNTMADNNAPPTEVRLADTRGSSGVVAQRLRIFVANATTSSAAGLPLLGIRSLRFEACDYPRATAQVSGGLSYAVAATPLVTLVSPRRGSTAGGTALTLSVTNLPAGLLPTDLRASVAGIAAAVDSVVYSGSVATVGVTTGAHGRTTAARPGVGGLELTAFATVRASTAVTPNPSPNPKPDPNANPDPKQVGTSAATANANYEYIDLWSRSTTWGGGPPPVEGDSVWIQPGQKILYDVSSPRLYMLIIQGEFIFDRADLMLDANYVFVMGKGSALVVGTEDEPFLQQATITLHGSPVSKELPLYGAKVLACRECTLDLHGRPNLDDRVHTKLAFTAEAGDATLVLTEPVDWPPNSMAFVSSTAANGTMEEAETVVIVGVEGGGTVLRLAGPLLYRHLGETYTVAGPHALEFRANVGLLSRNVVVQGTSPFSQLDKYGAHIKMHSRGDESLTARIENVEVRYAGQGFRLGRYPIHFHMIGTVRNSYVRQNSIHHTYNRAVVIHGVHYLRVINNVNFETMGNAYFVEDGIETKNVITHNLGANTRQSFAGLTVDQTPATYWLVNPDNYVASNIAAGSTHYGFWFFPEPKVRGASEFEPGSDQVCPQGTPLLWFADNEAHHCGSYGLRIFTNDPAGEHRGPSGSGYYPVATDPCAAASATNPYLPAQFRRQYSWRNGKNGVTVGSVAAIHLIDMVVADNNKVGFEFVGADGIQPKSMTSETKLRGKWGDNLLVRPLIVGHMLSCPNCDPSISLGITHVSMGSFVVPDNGKDCLNGCQTFDLGYEQRSDDYLFGGHLINAPRNDGNQNGKRLGLETPAWYGLTVQNASFVNFDREGMVAVGGFAKALPAIPLYSFENCGGMETRFSGTKWLQSDKRVHWRWVDEAILTDLDGTFTDNAPGCTVVHNNLVADPRAFPECYQDPRYSGTVCCGLKFVTVGMSPSDAMLVLGPDKHSGKVSYRPGPSGIYVEPTDAAYLRNKWRPVGAQFLVDFDASQASGQAAPRLIGEATLLNQGETNMGWRSATTTWTGTHALNMTFTYEDEFTLEEYTVMASAVVSTAGDELWWQVPAAARQLRTNVKWLNCERRATECAAGMRYDDVPAAFGLSKNTAQTPHFYGAASQFVLPLNRHYQYEVSESKDLIHHIEAMGLWLGPGMADDDWIEFEVNPFGAYQEYDAGMRPEGAVPMIFSLEGGGEPNVMDFTAVDYTRFNASWKALSNFSHLHPRSSMSWNGARKTVTLRVQGRSQCEQDQPWGAPSPHPTGRALVPPPHTPSPPSHLAPYLTLRHP